MKKMDRKGFTLIELLAVIVILAIIMVIAVPQILNVIDNSRKSAWKSNVKMIEEGLELGKTLTDTGMTDTSFNIGSVCTGTAKDVTTDISAVADISTSDTKVSCTTTAGQVTISPATDSKGAYVGQFKTQKAVTVTCSDGSCSDNWKTVYGE